MLSFTERLVHFIYIILKTLDTQDHQILPEELNSRPSSDWNWERLLRLAQKSVGCYKNNVPTLRRNKNKSRAEIEWMANYTCWNKYFQWVYICWNRKPNLNASLDPLRDGIVCEYGKYVNSLQCMSRGRLKVTCLSECFWLSTLTDH